MDEFALAFNSHVLYVLDIYAGEGPSRALRQRC
jgi:hypothetical protein